MKQKLLNIWNFVFNNIYCWYLLGILFGITIAHNFWLIIVAPGILNYFAVGFGILAILSAIGGLWHNWKNRISDDVVR